MARGDFLERKGLDALKCQPKEAITLGGGFSFCGRRVKRKNFVAGKGADDQWRSNGLTLHGVLGESQGLMKKDQAEYVLSG